MNTAGLKAAKKSSHTASPHLGWRRSGHFFSLSKKYNQPFFGPKTIQPKLKIGQPNDKYELEADRVADAVMKMSDSMIQRQSTEEEEELQMQPIEEEEELQMQPLEEEEELQMKCQACENEEHLQTMPAVQMQNARSNYTSPVITGEINASKGSGTPLPAKISSEMSTKIGADFSDVSVHTDSKAVQLNQAMGARAFTVGKDIFFNRNEYSPQSSKGKHLLAHELTHVLQQTNRSPFAYSIQKQDHTEVQPQENPSYDEAVDHLRTFYQRQQTLVNTIIDLKDRALELFEIYTGEAYNDRGPSTLELLEAALTLIPAATALRTTFTILRTQGSFVSQASELATLVSAVRPAITAGRQTAEGASQSSIEAARIEFRAVQIDELSDLQVSELANLWNEEDDIREQLREKRYDPPEVDLLSFVREGIGEIPNAANLTEEARLVRDKFELELYKKYYIEGGRAYVLQTIRDRGPTDLELPTSAPGLEAIWSDRGIPSRVQQRITNLNGWPQIFDGWQAPVFTVSEALGRRISMWGGTISTEELQLLRQQLDQGRNSLVIPYVWP